MRKKKQADAKKMAIKIARWNGKERLTTREFAALCAVDRKHFKKRDALLREQRLSVLGSVLPQGIVAVSINRPASHIEYAERAK